MAIQEKIPTLNFNRILKYVLNLWICIPAIAYLYLLNVYLVNIPMKDDYYAIIRFLLQFKDADFIHKISLIFSSHNEHKIVPSRIVYIVYNTIFAHVNFRNLAFIANCQLLVIFIIIVHFLKKLIPGYWTYIAFIFCVCIFDPSGYENGSWAMGAMQNYGVIMMFALSLYFYSREKKLNLVWALLFQFLCTFASGNGIIGAFFIVVYTFFDMDKRKRICSLAALFIFVPLYFVNYQANPEAPETMPGIQQIVSFFFGMLGSHYHTFDISEMLGVLIAIGLIIFLILNRSMLLKKEMLPLVCFTAFILGTMGVAALFRSHMTGIPFFSSRYLIYTHIMAAFTVLFVVLKLKEHKQILIPVAAIWGTILLYTYSENYKYGEAGFARESYRAENKEYYFTDEREAKEIIDKACKADIYCLDENDDLLLSLVSHLKITLVHLQ